VVPDTAGRPLPAGPYKVEASICDHDEVRRAKRDFKLSNGSNSVTVQVAAPTSPNPNAP
jgi:hypothetical protein